MHHYPAGPSLSARFGGALRRCGLLLKAALRASAGRLALAAAFTVALTGLVVAVPVMAGTSTDTPSVVLDASSTGSPDADGPATTSPSWSSESVTPAPTEAAPSTGITADPTPGEPTAPAPVTDDAAPSAADSPAPSSAGTTSPSSGSASTSTASGSRAPRTEEPVADAQAPASDDLLAPLDAARTAAGCDPLTVDPALSALARDHGRDEDDDAFPEDVEALVGRGPSLDDVVGEWLDDSDDAEAIRDCSVTSVGLGRADVDGDTRWTLLLA